MTFLLAFALLAPASVLAPNADAARSDVHVRAFHEGDLLRYEPFTEDAEGARTILLAEGPSRAVDAFGIPRGTDAFVTQVQDANDTVIAAERCHALSGSLNTVRRDALHGGASSSTAGTYAWGSGAIGSTVTVTRFDEERVSFARAACPFRTAVGDRTLAPGDVLMLSDLGAWDAASTPSDPGVAVRFHDRAAVRFTFPLNVTLDGPVHGVRVRVEGTLDATFADGLPGVVEHRLNGTYTVSLASGGHSWTTGCELFTRRCATQTETDAGSDSALRSFDSTVRLTGFVPGDGPALARVDPTFRLPHAHPDGRFTSPGPLALDDEALAFPYPFRDAFDTMRADPTIAMGDFLREHPDALVTTAFYDRHMRVTGAEHVPTEGGWEIEVHDGGASTCARSILLASAPRDLPVSAPERPWPAVNEECPAWRMFRGGDPHDFGIALPPRTPPARTVDSATLASVLATHGLRPDDIAVFRYDALRTVDGDTRAAFKATNVSEADPRGLTITLDGATGGTESVASTESIRVTTGLESVFPADGDALQEDRPRAFAALLAPATGAGLTVGGLAALALLALVAAKVAWPLYARIRADRVLEHPVRQKLFAHVRAHPGVHRAALVDVAGVGEGATRRHLDHLARERFVREVPDGGFVRYFAAGSVPPGAQARAAALRGRTTRRVHDLLVHEPHLSLREAAARLDLSAPTVHRAVKRLRKAGLLTEPGDAR